MRRVQALVVIVLSCAAVGCTHSAKYNPQYIINKPPLSGSVLEGKCLVYTESAEDLYRIASKPPSFFGPQDTIEFPVGLMAKEITVAAFGSIFRQGCESSNRIDNPLDYATIIRPKVTHMEHSYYVPFLALKTTPRVRIGLHISLYDENGEVFLRKQYDSEVVNGKPVFGVLPKDVNELAHSTLYNLMAEVAGDVRTIVVKKASAGRQASRPVKQATLAVAELATSSLSSGELSALAEKLRAALSDTGYFKVVSKEYMDYILSTRNFRSGGRNQPAVLIEMGKMLEVEKVISGSVSRSGDIMEISLSLIDVAGGKFEFESTGTLSGSLDKLGPAIRSLAEKIARREQKW